MSGNRGDKRPSANVEPPVLLIFDTETTGLASRDRKVRADPLAWPRLVEAGWILCHDDGQIICEQNRIVCPVGFDIPESAALIHGISTATAREEGHTVDEVLGEFCSAVLEADILVAHHLSFDIRIILSELIRIQKRNNLPTVPGICTMHSSARFCGIPGRFGKGFKNPSLSYLHTRLFDTQPPHAHRALADARSCAACYFELTRKGVRMEMETRIHQFFPGR